MMHLNVPETVEDHAAINATEIPYCYDTGYKVNYSIWLDYEHFCLEVDFKNHRVTADCGAGGDFVAALYDPEGIDRWFIVENEYFVDEV